MGNEKSTTYCTSKKGAARGHAFILNYALYIMNYELYTA